MPCCNGTSTPAFARQLPYVLSIDESVCRQCRRCLASQVCRGRAILSMDGERVIDMARCTGCLQCVIACPFEAVIKTIPGR